jgi:hypothetical protein
VVVQEGVAQLQQGRAQAVLAGLGILLHQLLRFQGAEETMDGGLGQPEPLGELGDPEARDTRTERLEDQGRPLDRLDHRDSLFRYC